MQPPNYLPEDGGETVWDAMEAISWDLCGYEHKEQKSNRLRLADLRRGHSRTAGSRGR
jgi:hypothetical protein